MTNKTKKIMTLFVILTISTGLIWSNYNIPTETITESEATTLTILLHDNQSGIMGKINSWQYNMTDIKNYTLIFSWSFNDPNYQERIQRPYIIVTQFEDFEPGVFYMISQLSTLENNGTYTYNYIPFRQYYSSWLSIDMGYYYGIMWSDIEYSFNLTILNYPQ